MLRRQLPTAPSFSRARGCRSAMAANPDSISGNAIRWMILGEWRAHPARVILAALAIAVGVALGFAVHLINASALNEFTRAVRTVNGDADLQVHATTPLG